MFKNISVTFFNQLIALVLGIANSIVLTRLLGIEGKGAFAILLAFIGLSAVFLNIGLPSAVTYFISSKKYPIHKIFHSGNMLIFMTTILFAALLLLNNRYFTSSFLIPSYLKSLKFELILIGFFFIKFCNSFFRAIYFGVQSIIKLNKIDIFFQLLATTIYITLFRFYPFDDAVTAYHKVLIIIGIQLALQTLNAIVNLMFLVSEKKMNFTLSFLSWKELKYFLLWGGIAYLANIFQFLNYRLDFWFVEFFSGIKAIGVYSLSVNLIQMIWILPNAISAVLFPYISNNSEQNQEGKTLLIGRVVFSLLIAVGLIACLLSKHIIPFLYGVDFSAASTPFNILLISAIPFGLITVYASYLVGKGMQVKNLIASCVGLLFTIILDLILIPKYGIEGAAWASTFSYLITSMYVLHQMKKHLKIGYTDLMLLKREDIRFIKNMIYGKRG